LSLRSASALRGSKFRPAAIVTAMSDSFFFLSIEQRTATRIF
jgi:hypothetical protein